MDLTIIMCFFYAILNVSGAALIKSEIPHHTLAQFGDYLRLLFSVRVICGFMIIAVSAVIMIKALSLGKFSYVVPLATGINFCLTVLLGVIFFSEKLSVFSYVGLLLILSGIIFMSLKTA